MLGSEVGCQITPVFSGLLRSVIAHEARITPVYCCRMPIDGTCKQELPQSMGFRTWLRPIGGSDAVREFAGDHEIARTVSVSCGRSRGWLWRCEEDYPLEKASEWDLRLIGFSLLRVSWDSKCPRLPCVFPKSSLPA